jgi:phospholipase C
MNQIEHLIVLIMENRSFDHYFGALSLPGGGRTDVEGLTPQMLGIPDVDGQLIRPWSMDDGPFTVPDPPHGWEVAHEDWNGGLNDRFVRQFQAVHPQENCAVPVGYYSRKTLPVLYQLADNFTKHECDEMKRALTLSCFRCRKQ